MSLLGAIISLYITYFVGQDSESCFTRTTLQILSILTFTCLYELCVSLLLIILKQVVL